LSKKGEGIETLFGFKENVSVNSKQILKAAGIETLFNT